MRTTLVNTYLWVRRAQKVSAPSLLDTLGRTKDTLVVNPSTDEGSLDRVES